MDRDPAALADGDAISAVAFPEPGNHLGGFRPMDTALGDVIVGQCDVKRIEVRREIHRQQAVAALGVVVTAEIFLPVLIPGALVVGSRVVLGRQFAHPEDGGHHVALPWQGIAQRIAGRLDDDPRRGRHAEWIAQRGQGLAPVIEKTLMNAGKAVRQTSRCGGPHEGGADDSDAEPGDSHAFQG